MPFSRGSDFKYFIKSCPRFPKVIGSGGSLRNFLFQAHYLRIDATMRGVGNGTCISRIIGSPFFTSFAKSST